VIFFILFVIAVCVYIVWGKMNPAKPIQDSGLGKRFLWTLPGAVFLFVVFVVVGVVITIANENWFTGG